MLSTRQQGMRKAGHKWRPMFTACTQCGKIARYAGLNCTEYMCPWKLRGSRPEFLSRMPNKHLEAIYRKRDKIDDTITSPEDYMEICERIDELADDMGEKTFKEWRKEAGDV